MRMLLVSSLFVSAIGRPSDWNECSLSENSICEDVFTNCSALADAGTCFSDPALMDSNCRKSCGRCFEPLPTACDGNATCCKHPFSNSKLGCCPLGSNAVCCNDYTCCPEGTVCQDSGSGYHVQSKCIDATTGASKMDGLQICKPGAALPLAGDQKNCLIIGDSVSIGYTPFVNSLLNNTAGGCLVQHSPFAGDGGVEETAYGVQCLEYFLRSSDGDEIMKNVDLVYFNWGLHNLVPDGSAASPGQSGNQGDYLPYLEKIVDRLVQIREELGVKLLFGLTSPEMCDASQDDIVLNLNRQAAQLMARNSVPTVDMHGDVIFECGQPPQDTCLGKEGGGCPHYSGDGYKWIAENSLAPAFKSVLAADADCAVTVYDNWADEIKRDTGVIETVYGAGTFPLQKCVKKASSVKVSGKGCKAYGYTTADCSGAPSGSIDWNTQVGDYPAGIVAPASNLEKFWGCNDCAQCIRVEHDGANSVVV